MNQVEHFTLIRDDFVIPILNLDLSRQSPEPDKIRFQLGLHNYAITAQYASMNFDIWDKKINVQRFLRRLIMKKYILTIAILLLLALGAACQPGETPTPELITPTEAPPTAEPTPEPSATPESLPILTRVPVAEILDIQWQWAELREIEPATGLLVMEPQNYTLVLQEDNTYLLKADCNQGGGNYAASEDGKLLFQPGPITLAECGPESLYNQYLQLVSTVTEFGKLGEQLALLVNNGIGLMLFNNGGPAEELVPEPELCAGITMSSVNLLTMGLPDTWKQHCLPQSDYDDSQPSGATGLPEHIQVNFNVSAPGDKVYGDPIIYLIPVDEYIAQWDENDDSSVQEAITELKDLLQQQPEVLPSSGMPVLPFEEVTGVNDLSVQGEYLDTNMGFGVRFVGRFAQGTVPVSNDNPPMFYIFQGFTEDEQYLISFIYPVSSSALPSADQISEEERQTQEANPDAYLNAKAAELNALEASDWQPMLTTLDGVIDSLTFEYEKAVSPIATVAPTAQLTNINWQWVELVTSDPDFQGITPNRQDYTLVFYNDGTLSITADCNFGSGTYRLGDDTLKIQVGSMTRANCGSASYSDEFLALLDRVSSYNLAVQRLDLNLNDNASRMGFVNGGAVISVVPPGQGVPTAVTTDTVNVRSGPGNQYPSYGIVTSGTQFTVIGISEDGGWWVVKIPTSLAADGRGWINASYVETSNTENVPVVPAPPVGSIPTPTPTKESTPTPTQEPTPYP